MNDPLTHGLCIFYSLLTAKNVFSMSFFQKILPLCMVSIQERFVIKSGLWWRAYGTYIFFSNTLLKQIYERWIFVYVNQYVMPIENLTTKITLVRRYTLVTIFYNDCQSSRPWDLRKIPLSKLVPPRKVWKFGGLHTNVHIMLTYLIAKWGVLQNIPNIEKWTNFNSA